MKDDEEFAEAPSGPAERLAELHALPHDQIEAGKHSARGRGREGASNSVVGYFPPSATPR
jgi:hypothetical protein